MASKNNKNNDNDNSDKNTTNNKTNMNSHFAVAHWDCETTPKHSRVYTRYFEERVNLSYSSAKKEQEIQSEWHAVNRGYLLLQQSTMNDILFLVAFQKEKKRDTEPDFLIPVGMIAQMDTARVKSENGPKTMGRVTIITHATVDARLVLGPMKIVICLFFAGMQALEHALEIGTALFPDQHKKLVFAP